MPCLTRCLPRSEWPGSSRCGCLAGRELPGGRGRWCSSLLIRCGQGGGSLRSTTGWTVPASACHGQCRLPSQLVHVDLDGNVLFADGMTPAVIDFSPLERPAGLPLAVVAVDALQWHQALPEVLDQLAGEPELDQLLARALIYRHVTEIVRHGGTPGIDRVARAGKPVTDLVLTRLSK